MSVLVYTENWDGVFKKSTFEVVSYAKKVAEKLKTNLTAISLDAINEHELEKLAKYGVDNVISCPKINKGDSQSASKLFKRFSDDIEVFVFSSTYSGRMIAPRLSAKLKAALITNVITLPETISPICVKRQSFSSKAIEKIIAKTEKTILSIAPNSYQIIKTPTDLSIKILDVTGKADITFEKQEKTGSKISLSDAEIIVSAGRGLKDPGNWKMIEELAEALKAATACSKPVSDIGWRPHSEHVGQTGKAVAPNLYIAIGISGAIQHLAGVNSSKIMVVINTDPEAPFFKSADYGIVGDAFEVVPKMIKEIKKLNT